MREELRTTILIRNYCASSLQSNSLKPQYLERSARQCCTSYSELPGESKNKKPVADIAVTVVKIKLPQAVTALNVSASMYVYLGTSHYTINYVRPKRIIPHSVKGIW